MDTSGLDTFAQQLRKILISGVKQRLEYWGFNEDGSFDVQPSKVEGGYTFRGEVFDDDTVPQKWTRLKNAIQRHDYQYVAEEAAYTWFNRLMATRVLEKNDQIQPVLEYTGDLNEPAILTRAKEGVIEVGDAQIEDSVRQAILDNDEDQALRILLTDFCNRNEVLQGVFGDVSKYTEILLPTGLLRSGNVIDRLVGEDPITEDQYEQVELIGWLYQFYISDKKDEVYDKSGKFEPEDIPAATQIFTPRWIVRYMVENTIGRQWLDKYPDSPLREEMEYLVESDNEPADPIFDDISELQLFDPAAGSGHILVVGFELLMGMYRELGYSDRDAVQHILEDNLYGVDIDRRAVQLARFALLMKASEYDERIFDRMEIEPQVYAMPEPHEFSDAEIEPHFFDAFLDEHGEELKDALELMSERGQNVGSALKFDLSEDVREQLSNAYGNGDSRGAGELKYEAATIDSYIKPLSLLTDNYSAVVSNPPYASSRNINKELKNYLKDAYPDGYRDLFGVFMKLFPDFTDHSGRFGFITPPSWMFLSSYEDLRREYIENYFFESLAQLSRGVFGADFGSVTTVLQNKESNQREGTYFRLVERTFQEFHVEHLHKLFRHAIDDPKFRYDFSSYEKDGSIPDESDPDGARLYHPDVDQRDFEKIPGSPIAYWASKSSISAFQSKSLLKEVARPRKGFDTGGAASQFFKMWTEVNAEKIYEENKDLSEIKWVMVDKGGGYRKWYGNRENVVLFGPNGKELYKKEGANIRNKSSYFKKGITYSVVSSAEPSFRISTKNSIFYQSAGTSIVPEQETRMDIIGLLNTAISNHFLSLVNPTLNYTVGDVGKIPVILEDSSATRDKVRQALRISKRDYNSRETSREFTTQPLIELKMFSIRIAYERWRHQVTDEFFQLQTVEEELNELYAKLYDLEDELHHRVPLDDITILKDELDWDAVEQLDDKRGELSDEQLRQRFLKDDPADAIFKVEVPIRQFLSYGIGVMFGRYRLGRDGLHIAHPEPTDEELTSYEVDVPLAPENTDHTEMFDIDGDAIVPLMGTDSPFNDSAVHRMQEIVRMVWGEETLTENLNFINHALSVGRSRGLKRDYEKTMEEWLVEDFWEWHKSLYSVPYYGKKPIYWLFQSPEGHFQVLVYMHRMDKYTPQRVRQDYLRRYREYIDSEIEKLESSDELDADDEKRLDELRDKKADCREYSDILKEVAEKQIEIDLDDGVQNNYPKFGDALADL